MLLLLAVALLQGCAGLTHQTAPDVNYYSIAGDESGSLWVDGTQVRTGALPMYEIPALSLNLPAVNADVSRYNDILKFSHAQNVHLGKVVVITGGKQIEQAIDMNNRCRNIVIDEAQLQEGQENALTIKGGCFAIEFGILSITPGQGHCDIELGGVSEQDPIDPTEAVRLRHVEMTDGRACRLRVLNATAPTIDEGNVVTAW